MERADLARLLGVPLAVGEARAVVVDAREPERFMEAFADAVACGGTVFLADPDWGQKERAEFAAMVDQPCEQSGRGWLAIPTGGSSGSLKLARHDEQTLSAAVNGFAKHFHTGRINFLGLLPLHHVSGLMAWMRCVLTGGTYRPWSSRALMSGDRPVLEFRPEGWYLSLVPTQLVRLIKDGAAVEWLRQFRVIFIGGGPSWPQLLDEAARLRLPLSLTYGMTETAAMVAGLRPEEFLAGRRGCGQALPHARVSVSDDGTVTIAAESLFLGYYPEFRPQTAWSPEDLGRIDADGDLEILGRRDGLINSGGEKIDPTEVEAALRATGAFEDVAVIGLADAEWGEMVVACFADGPRRPDLSRVRVSLESALAAYKQPRHYLPIAGWPRGEHGKVNRLELRARAMDALRSGSK